MLLGCALCLGGMYMTLFIEKVLVGDHGPGVPVGSDEECGKAGAKTSMNEAVMPYILMILLSVHSVVEGLAIGCVRGTRGQQRSRRLENPKRL